MRSIWGLSMGAILIKFEKVVPKKLKFKTVKTNRRDDTLPLLNYENVNLPTPKLRECKLAPLNYTPFYTYPPKLYPFLHFPP